MEPRQPDELRRLARHPDNLDQTGWARGGDNDGEEDNDTGIGDFDALCLARDEARFARLGWSDRWDRSEAEQRVRRDLDIVLRRKGRMALGSGRLCNVRPYVPGEVEIIRPGVARIIGGGL